MLYIIGALADIISIGTVNIFNNPIGHGGGEIFFKDLWKGWRNGLSIDRLIGIRFEFKMNYRNKKVLPWKEPVEKGLWFK